MTLFLRPDKLYPAGAIDHVELAAQTPITAAWRGWPKRVKSHFRPSQHKCPRICGKQGIKAYDLLCLDPNSRGRAWAAQCLKLQGSQRARSPHSTAAGEDRDGAIASLYHSDSATSAPLCGDKFDFGHRGHRGHRAGSVAGFNRRWLGRDRALMNVFLLRLDDIEQFTEKNLQGLVGRLWNHPAMFGIFQTGR